MDLPYILTELKQRRTEIDTAIRSLELMSAGQKRRGRPPKWVIDATAANATSEPKRRGRPPGSKNKGR